MEPGGSVLIFYGAFEANDSKEPCGIIFINKIRISLNILTDKCCASYDFMVK